MDFWSAVCPVRCFFLEGLVAASGAPELQSVNGASEYCRTALTRRLKLQAGCCKASNAIIRLGIQRWNLEQLVTQKLRAVFS